MYGAGIEGLPVAQFAGDEGEGFESVADWRTAHEAFWQSAEMETALGSAVEIDDGTLGRR
jgi:uncharacterized protein YhfF